MPGFLKDSFTNAQNAPRKTWVDLGLFVGGIYCIYYFGKDISDSVDYMMPDEEEMQKQISEAFAAQGAMMPPM